MRTRLSLFTALILAIIIAACGPTTPTAIPTTNPNAATVEASITPNPELAEDATTEVTAENTAEATAEGTAGALNTAFSLQITGDTPTTINSDDGASVAESVSGASNPEGSASQNNTGSESAASPSGQSVLNTPLAILHTISFTNADGSYTFDLIISDGLAPAKYQIGVDNVVTTVGNNINENSAGNTQGEITTLTPGASVAAESTAQVKPTSSPTANGSAAEATAENTAEATTQVVTSLNDANPPAANPSLGISERDENLPPTIAARLTSDKAGDPGYNLVQDGTLTITKMNNTSASGSFEFTLASQQDISKTIQVKGTFTDISLTPASQ